MVTRKTGKIYAGVGGWNFALTAADTFSFPSSAGEKSPALSSFGEIPQCISVPAQGSPYACCI